MHPETGEPLKDYWVEIGAIDDASAREKMFELFGAKWAFQYRVDAFSPEYYSKGCYVKYEIN